MRDFLKSSCITLGLLTSSAVSAGTLVDTVSIESMTSRFAPSEIAKSSAFVRINNYDASARNVVISFDTNGNNGGEVIREVVRVSGHSFVDYEIPTLFGGNSNVNTGNLCNIDFTRFVIDSQSGGQNPFTYQGSGNFPCNAQFINIAITWTDQVSFGSSSTAAGGVRHFTPINASIYKVYESTVNGTGNGRAKWLTEPKTMDRIN